MRRRERRLRSWQKHERQTVRMVLVETFHHSSAPFPPKFKEDQGDHALHVEYQSGWGSIAPRAVRRRHRRVAAALSGPQERVQWHTVEPILETFVPVLLSMFLCRSWWTSRWMS